MQALRNASFMNEPTLTGVKTLLIIGLYQTKSGRVQDAWALFGLIARLAQAIKLHRDPETLDFITTSHERAVRRSVWWFMLYSDQYLSSILSRPIGISSFGDCAPPIPSATNVAAARLSGIVHEFTIIARRILSSEGSPTTGKFCTFTDELLALWKTMPKVLQFNENWQQLGDSLPEWPLDVISASKKWLEICEKSSFHS